jgi:hypothetical protein
MQNTSGQVQFNNTTPSSIPQNMGDSIQQLPADQAPPTHDEIKIVDSIFKEHHSTIQIILNDAKSTILIGILFIIFSIPQLDDLIRKFVTIAESPYILILIKSVIFMVFY